MVTEPTIIERALLSRRLAFTLAHKKADASGCGLRVGPHHGDSKEKQNTVTREDAGALGAFEIQHRRVLVRDQLVWITRPSRSISQRTLVRFTS